MTPKTVKVIVRKGYIFRSKGTVYMEGAGSEGNLEIPYPVYQSNNWKFDLYDEVNTGGKNKADVKPQTTKTESKKEDKPSTKGADESKTESHKATSKG